MHTGNINNKIKSKTFIFHTTFGNLLCIKKPCGRWSRPVWANIPQNWTIKDGDSEGWRSPWWDFPSDEIQDTSWKSQDWQLLLRPQSPSHFWHCLHPRLLRQLLFPTLTFSPGIKITPSNQCPSSSNSLRTSFKVLFLTIPCTRSLEPGQSRAYRIIRS